MTLTRWKRGHLLLALIGASLILTPACQSARTQKPLKDTGVTDLPPIPETLATKATCTTTRYSSQCAAVPSGRNNCLDLLRREAEVEIANLLGSEMEEKTQAALKRGSKGTSQGPGAVSEERVFFTEFTKTVSGHINFRMHESPLMTLSRGDEYVLRVCAVNEEAFFQMYTDAAEEAQKADLPDLADALRAIRTARYGEKPPDHDAIEDVEKDIARHYSDLWKMTAYKSESTK